MGAAIRYYAHATSKEAVAIQDAKAMELLNSVS